MPFKTRYGSHYHMTEGCHGATIPCDTTGLTPCSDCCGNGQAGSSEASAGSMSSGMPSSVMRAGDGTSYAADDQPASPSASDEVATPDNRTAPSDGSLATASQITEIGMGASSEGIPAPDVTLGEDSESIGAVVAPRVEGIDYPDKGSGWQLRKRGHDYSLPMGGGGGYASLTRKQAGVVYGAVKRGDVVLDRKHVREMYDVVGRPWYDLDLHERSVMMHVDAAVGYLVSGRAELAQAELDGRYVREETRVVGTRMVEVTEDNWIDFAFDFDHDYEVGDMAEEEVTETYWVIGDKEQK